MSQLVRGVLDWRRMQPARTRDLALARLALATRDRRHRNAEILRRLVGEADQAAAVAIWTRWRALELAERHLRCASLEIPGLTQAAEKQARIAHPSAAIQLLVSRHLQRALVQADIPNVVMKGPAMAKRIHGNHEARGKSSDIDLLVSPEHLFAARDCLVALGWQSRPVPTNRAGYPIMHFHLVSPKGAPSIDLHWRSHWFFGSEAFCAAMLERSRLDDGLQVPGPADDLIILLTSYARDGFAGLRLPADIAGWWDSNVDRADDPYEPLRAATNTSPELRAALAASSVIAEQVVGTAPFTLVPTRRVAAVTARVGARIAHEPLDPNLEFIKRTVVDASVAPHDLRRRWSAEWLPRRARSVTIATALGTLAHRLLLWKQPRRDGA